MTPLCAVPMDCPVRVLCTLPLWGLNGCGQNVSRMTLALKMFHCSDCGEGVLFVGLIN
jgi:hypothetical protein